MTDTPTFLLVHGAFSNSFAFAPLQAELGLRGHRSAAIDLPGHGFAASYPAGYQAPQDFADLAGAPSTAAGVSLADNVEAIVGALERAREHGPTILLAHSRGGLAVTMAANARPDLIDHLVYVSAWAPIDLSVGGYYAEPEMAEVDPNDLAGGMVADPRELGALRSNFRTADPTTLAGFRNAMLHTGTQAEFRVVLSLFQPDENLDVGTEDDRAAAATWGSIPRTFLRLVHDRSMPPAVQDRMIAEGDRLTPDNPWTVHDLDSDHMRWLVRPAEAAAILARIAHGVAAGDDGDLVAPAGLA